jgi:hypothetical protein
MIKMMTSIVPSDMARSPEGPAGIPQKRSRDPDQSIIRAASPSSIR